MKIAGTKKRMSFLVLYTLLVLGIGGLLGGLVSRGESYDSCGCPNSGGFFVGIERHEEMIGKDIFYWVRNNDGQYKVKAVFGGVGNNYVTIQFSRI